MSVGLFVGEWETVNFLIISLSCLALSMGKDPKGFNEYPSPSSIICCMFRGYKQRLLTLLDLQIMVVLAGVYRCIMIIWSFVGSKVTY